MSTKLFNASNPLFKPLPMHNNHVCHWPPPKTFKSSTRGLELDACTICSLEYGPDHLPVRFTAHEGCNHAVGKSCLEAWFPSANDLANACPTCRRQLCRKDDDNQDLDELDGAEGTEIEEDDQREVQRWIQVPEHPLSRITEPVNALQFAYRLEEYLRAEIGNDLHNSMYAIGDDRLMALLTVTCQCFNLQCSRLGRADFRADCRTEILKIMWGVLRDIPSPTPESERCDCNSFKRCAGLADSG
jgi:hypothetical protein